MEVIVSSQAQKQNLQTPGRKNLLAGYQKDLWLIAREGSLNDLESSLALMKKSGGNINSRNNFGLTPLHIATWRNHIPIVRRLLAAGADPDARDGESGWSCLHRALHFGHLAVAGILLQHGASITLEDSKSRIPLDLLSGPVLQIIGYESNSVATEVFSWGSGTNYQLGTGNAHIQKLPCKVDSLNGSFMKLISAAKFHSVAVTARGEVYTWGFGRGGRLGHPDFDIHSGQAAVITPRQVTSGLGSLRVKAIAAAKHHTVIATEGGQVFTWGSNREGQLGYTSVDSQPTPRRVTSLRSKIISVAAANKHTAVVSDLGEVFTWGCNREGQLGYGTSNSASNYTPHVVEYLKGKKLIGVSAAKYHTIVLGSDGEVYTWGHRHVTPRRVAISRNLKKSGSIPLKFHRMERLHVIAIAAGMVHSMALTDDGSLFCWVSSDPDLRCQQIYDMCGKNIVSLSAGKYWTAAVTATGDVYMWDGKKGKDKPPVATRIHGMKRATSVSVGETHLLIVASLYHPGYPRSTIENSQNLKLDDRDDVGELSEDILFGDMEINMISRTQTNNSGQQSVPSLKSLCEKVAAEYLVEPRNAIQLLEIADSLGADDLKKYCEEIVVRNLDYIFTVSPHAIASASPDILANLERLLDQRSSEPWNHRHLPTPTATFPVVINSEEDESEMESQRIRDEPKKLGSLMLEVDQNSFLQPKDDPNQEISKAVRALRKKLQQIEMLEAKQSNGYVLDGQQIAKLQSKPTLLSSLMKLGVPVETLHKESSSVPSEGKGTKNSKVPKKQRRKSSKSSVLQTEAESVCSGTGVIPEAMKDLLCIDILEFPNTKVDADICEQTTAAQGVKESAFILQKNDSLEMPKNKGQSPKVSKKKSKKGGLSMFLSGALDDAPKEVAPPPPPPKNEGPAWGGVKFLMGSATLREIQDEQSKNKESQSASGSDQSENVSYSGSGGKIRLSSFLPSSPIPVASTRSFPVSDGEKSTPTWAASGTPPHPSRPSLRDIQMQQGKKQQNISHSPKTRTAGFNITTSQGSPSDASGVNRWFKPEVETPSSLRSIQIEEKAMKDLKRFYSSVKIIKSQS